MPNGNSESTHDAATAVATEEDSNEPERLELEGDDIANGGNTRKERLPPKWYTVSTSPADVMAHTAYFTFASYVPKLLRHPRPSE